jgi:hypothetical protein
MGVGLSMLVILVNVLEAPPVLAGGLWVTYLLVGGVILANYCVDHEDEIPTRSQRRANRRR